MTDGDGRRRVETVSALTTVEVTALELTLSPDTVQGTTGHADGSGFAPQAKWYKRSRVNRITLMQR